MAQLNKFRSRAQVEPSYEIRGHFQGDCTINESYQDTLKQICKQTGTDRAYSHVLLGIKESVFVLKNDHLRADFSQGEQSISAITLMIMVWFVVCHRIRIGCRPYKQISTRFGSLQNAVTDILDYEDRSRMKHFILFWETRLYIITDRWLERPWYRAIPRHGDFPTAPRHSPSSSIYLEALVNGGLVHLAESLLDNEKLSGHVLLSEGANNIAQRKVVVEEIAMQLATTDASLLKSLIGRTLAQDAHIPGHPTKVALETMDKYKTRKDINVPCTYINIICDRAGFPPTTFQWRKLCIAATGYLEGTDAEAIQFVEKVDRQFFRPVRWDPNFAKLGHRRYMDFDYDSLRPVKKRQHRIENTTSFVSKMMLRIEEAEAAGAIHVSSPEDTVEVGYTMNPFERLQDHRKHNHSNYIMNLTQAIFEILYPDTFVLQQHVLHVHWRSTQCRIGEIIFTQLADGYTTHAGGYSHYPAGFSNFGAYRRYASADWDAFERAAAAKWDFAARLERDNAESKVLLEHAQACKASVVEQAQKGENLEIQIERTEPWMEIVDLLEEFDNV